MSSLFDDFAGGSRASCIPLLADQRGLSSNIAVKGSRFMILGNETSPVTHPNLSPAFATRNQEDVNGLTLPMLPSNGDNSDIRQQKDEYAHGNCSYNNISKYLQLFFIFSRVAFSL
jgi:hypothetical protein